MATTTVSGAGAHAAAALTDRIPATKAGVKGYLTPLQIRTLLDSLGMPRLLYSTAGPTASTNSLTEAVLDDWTLPGGTMGARSQLIIMTYWSMTTSGNSKTVLQRFGGTAFHNQAVTASGLITDMRVIRNRTTSSQLMHNAAVGNGGWAQANLSPLTTAIDTTSDVVIRASALVANAADSVTLQARDIFLVTPAS